MNPTTISAAELFDRYAATPSPWFEGRPGQQERKGTDESPVRVSGTVERTLLGADKAARIVLRADERGLATLVCRCTSDEVLWRVAPGDNVTVEGVCRGLEDSLTLVMELCELAAPKRRQASLLRVLNGGREPSRRVPDRSKERLP